MIEPQPPFWTGAPRPSGSRMRVPFRSTRQRRNAKPGSPSRLVWWLHKGEQAPEAGTPTKPPGRIEQQFQRAGWAWRKCRRNDSTRLNALLPTTIADSNGPEVRRARPLSSRDGRPGSHRGRHQQQPGDSSKVRRLPGTPPPRALVAGDDAAVAEDVGQGRAECDNHGGVINTRGHRRERRPAVHARSRRHRDHYGDCSDGLLGQASDSPTLRWSASGCIRRTEERLNGHQVEQPNQPVVTRCRRATAASVNGSAET